MNADVQRALDTDQVIDITTTGRRSGRETRLEIWFHRIDGRYYITGRPGPRDWYANLVANPEFIVHFKGTTTADVTASATPITGPETRRAVLSAIVEQLRLGDPGEWVQRAPLVEFTVSG